MEVSVRSAVTSLWVSFRLIPCCCLFSYQVMSDSFQSHELQHARLPSPSLSPRICSYSCPLSRWCHPTIASSVTSVSCPQSCPASGSFPMCWLFTSGGQSIGISATILPVKIQGRFPLELTGLISLQSKGFLRVFSSATIQKLSNCFLNSLVKDCMADISQQEDHGLCSGEQRPWEGGGAEGGAHCTETSVNPRRSSGPADLSGQAFVLKHWLLLVTQGGGVTLVSSSFRQSSLQRGTWPPAVGHHCPWQSRREQFRSKSGNWASQNSLWKVPAASFTPQHLKLTLALPNEVPTDLNWRKAFNKLWHWKASPFHQAENPGRTPVVTRGPG